MGDCVESDYTILTYGGILVELLGILGLFYAMMVLTDKFLMG
jgi:hypothetical protein